MAKRISLDCDGVIVDVGSFFKKYFFNYFDSQASQEFIKSCYENKLEEGSKKENKDYQEILDFFKKYKKDLFLSLPELEMVSGAKEGIEEIKQRGIEVIVNSYRPSEYNGLAQDTKRLTRDWFNKKDIYVPFHLAETKEEKCFNINSQVYNLHVDDDKNILTKLNKKVKPILFNNLISSSAENFLQFDSWPKLTKFLTEEENV